MIEGCSDEMFFCQEVDLGRYYYFEVLQLARDSKMREPFAATCVLRREESVEHRDHLSNTRRVVALASFGVLPTKGST